METPTYAGDAEYCLDTTGDAVAGDDVRFARAVFSGSYRKPVFSGFELVTGKIVRESYGAETAQHTFTLDLGEGRTTRIKGRNLYKHGVWRRRWADETIRDAVLEEKHRRGVAARHSVRPRY